jgi:iron complex outermembrane receptor protein
MSSLPFTLRPIVLAIGAIAILPGPAFSQAASSTLDPVVVRSRTEAVSPDLTQPSSTGSRVGLTVRETPASVEVIPAATIEARGAQTTVDVLRGATGITAGGAPGSPGIASSRGFVGNAVTYLYDGERLSQTGMSARVQDAFNLDRVEILRGPASVLYGDGAIGGAVNFITRRAARDQESIDGAFSVGSFGTTRLGVGIGRNLGESGAVRVDYSRLNTDGYVERNKQTYEALTSSAMFRLSRDVRLDLALDWFRDDIKAYWGSPLLPTSVATQPTSVVSAAGQTLDRQFLFRNFNVLNPRMDSESLWTRAALTWDLNRNWSVVQRLSYYSADRRWQNAEVYTFAAPSFMNRSQVDIGHDHKVFTYRAEARYNGTLAGLRNRFTAGFEWSRTDFSSERRFSDGSASTNAALRVDAFNPVLGLYNPAASLQTGGGNRANFVSEIPSTALYFENALTLSPSWTLVAGLRTDRFELRRTIDDLNLGTSAQFSRKYDPVSGRVGAVFNWSPSTTFYAQYANASNPVQTLLLSNAANATFELSRGTQLEVGMKQSVGSNFEWTLALYQIKLDNILTRDSANPALTVQGGEQSSRGIEVAAAWRPHPQLTLSGNIAALEAKFDRLIEAGGANRAGNRPPNVPELVINAFADWRFANSPWSMGASVNHTGDFFTSNANTVKVNGATLADAYIRWSMNRRTAVTARVRNLFDTEHATWTGASATQVIVGTPRAIELGVRTSF